METSTPLCEIMAKHGSDKGPPQKHSYTRVYHELFENMRNEKLRVFELGLGTTYSDIPSNMSSMPKSYRPGASLRGWKEYFPNSQIYGADVDKRVLFSEERISTSYCDQTNPSSIKDLWSHFDEPFDIIIEDGLHTYEANLCFLENSLHKTKRFFVIEDVHTSTLEKFKHIIQVWFWQKKNSGFKITFYESPNKKIKDDNLIIFERISDYENEEMYPVLLEHFTHIERINDIMKESLGSWRGCGSYMCDGQSAEYQWSFFHKQQLLYKAVKNNNCDHILEIGVHGGHSLLLMLMANPEARITAVDPCYWSHTKPCIEYLQSSFPLSKIKLLPFTSEKVVDAHFIEKNAFDLVHVDGAHGYTECLSDIEWSLIMNPKTIVFDDIDNPGVQRTLKEFAITLDQKSSFPFRNGLWHVPSPKVHFVTAMFDIGDPRGLEIYANSAKNMLKYTPHVKWTIFTDCAEKIGILPTKNVDIVSTSLSEVFPFDTSEDFELPKMKTDWKDTKSYFLVQLTKIFLCEKVLESNPELKSIAWCDFGLFKNKGKCDRSIGAMLSRISQLDISHNYFAGFNAPPINSKLNCYSVCWTFAGSFFAGERKQFLKLANMYSQICYELLINQKKLVWEINIWSYIVSNYSHLITFYFSSNTNHKDGLLQGLLNIMN